MRKVERYDLELCDGESGKCTAELRGAFRGDWVEFSDYDALEDRYNDVAAELTAAHERIDRDADRLTDANTTIDDLTRERDAALRTVAGLERMLKTQRLLMKWRPRCTCTNCTARGYNDNWTINHGDDWQTFPTLAAAVAAWVEANPEGK